MLSARCLKCQLCSGRRWEQFEIVAHITIADAQALVGNCDQQGVALAAVGIGDRFGINGAVRLCCN